MQTMRRAWAALAVAAFAAGCANVPQQPPAKPHFQREGESPFVWRLPEIALAGTAEYGAELTLTRDPAFEAGEQPTGEGGKPVVADPYTAQFTFQRVKLKPGANTFTLVAKNAFGLSEAAKLQVTYLDQPSGIEVTLSSNIVVAGESLGQGALTATAKLVAGADGLKLSGRDVTFLLGGTAGGEPKTVQTDDSGTALVSFTGLVKVGPATVTAALGDGKDLSVSDTKPFVVSAGPAAEMHLLLSKAGATGAGGSSLELKAGEDATASVQVKDGASNVLDAPVALFTDAPGAVITGLRITNLRTTGTYRVVAAVSGAATRQGAAVSDVATLTVDAGDPKTVKLTAPAQATAGEAIGYQATLFDQFGNVVDGAARPIAIDATSDAQAQVKQADKTVTFKTAGAQKLIATVANTSPALSDQVSVQVAPALPATLQVALAATDKVPSTDLLDVEASASANIQVNTTVKDAFGNLVPNAGVLLSTDGPGYFDGSVLKGLVKAGSYEVRAVAAQGALVDREKYQVVAAAGSTITLDLGASAVDAGTPVAFNARAWDPYGNLAADALLVSVDALQAGDYVVDAAAKTLAVRRAGASAWTVRVVGATNQLLLPATASLLVRPGAAQTLGIDVQPSNTVVAGTNPGFTATAKDAYGNTLVNPPFAFSVLPTAGTLVDPPGPIVSAGKIYNLIRPGTYQLIAQLPGTGLTNDLTDPKATLTVTAADAAAVSLQLSRSVADVGSAVDFRVSVKDAFGNAATGSPTVSVKQGSTVVAPVVDGTSWTASAAGSYQLVATLVAGSKTLTDTQTLTVNPAADYTAPTLSFDRPTGDPTIAAWPPPDKVATACAGGNGDLVSVSATDSSLVQQVWFDFGGLATPLASGTAPAVGFPQSPFAASVPLCNAQVSGTRGEVLVKFAASDTRGNYGQAQGSWCLDADAQNYLPANAPVSRCAVLKAEATAAKTMALAANQAGDLVLAREQANGDTSLLLFTRTDGYGLGQVHTMTGFGSPRGVSLFGRTAFVSAMSTTKSFIQRTRSLDRQGNGIDDQFVAVDTTADQFLGVLYSQDGALYATVSPRDAAGYSTRLYRFASPLDFSKSYTQLPSAAAATSSTLRLTALCDGARSGDLFAAGYQKPANTGDAGKAVLVRINANTGAITTVFADTDTRTIGGCQLTKAGVAIALSNASGTAITVVDPATGQLAAAPYMTAYSNATGQAVPKPLGMAVANGYLFAATSEASSGSLLRFARPGGF